MRALAALGALLFAITLSACGASAGAGRAASGESSPSSQTLAPSTYFNPVPTCSALDASELRGLLGGAQPTAARPTTGYQGEFKSCTWTGGAGASSNALLTLGFEVPSIECAELEPAAGVSVLPGVGSFAYYQDGRLTAWKDNLEVLLQVASPAPPQQLATLMSTDVNSIFARMGAT